jgi:hypothetical protein
MSLIDDLLTAIQGPAAERELFHLLESESEEEPEPEPKSFTEHIKAHGFPRFLSYKGERHDN